MSASKNFVQYIDDTYTVKVKEVVLLDGTYVVNGIDTEFFILSLFVENKRVQGVEIFNYDNLMCKSVINDLGIIDLNTITKNHFFTAFSSVQLVVSNQIDNSSVGGKCCTYGIVRPTFVYTKNLITKNSKFIRFQRLVGATYPEDITVEYGGFQENTLEPYVKPFYGGVDLDPLMSPDYLSVKALYSLDDLFFRFSKSTYVKYFDVKLIINPDSNTFSFMHADPLFVYSDADYNQNSISDTLNLKTGTLGGSSINAFVRWKNVPELESDPT